MAVGHLDDEHRCARLVLSRERWTTNLWNHVASEKTSGQEKRREGLDVAVFIYTDGGRVEGTSVPGRVGAGIKTRLLSELGETSVSKTLDGLNSSML